MCKKLVLSAVLLWLLLFSASFAALQMQEPEGSGFTRGFNRIGAFFQWQAAASFVAVVAAVAARRLSGTETRATKLLAYGTAGVSGLLWLTLVGLVVFTVLTKG